MSTPNILEEQLTLDMETVDLKVGQLSPYKDFFCYIKKSMCILLQSSNIVFQGDQFIQNKIHIKEEITIMLIGTKTIMVSYKKVECYIHLYFFKLVKTIGK